MGEISFRDSDTSSQCKLRHLFHRVLGNALIFDNEGLLWEYYSEKRKSDNRRKDIPQVLFSLDGFKISEHGFCEKLSDQVVLDYAFGQIDICATEMYRRTEEGWFRSYYPIYILIISFL